MAFKKLNSTDRKKQTEEENELYLEEYGERSKVSGHFRGAYTICDIHRKIYRMVVDEADKLSNVDKQEELKYYLQRAYTIAKKTDAKLRQYKHNYRQYICITKNNNIKRRCVRCFRV